MPPRVGPGRTIGVLAILIVLFPFSFWVVSLGSRARTYRELVRYHVEKEAAERRNVEVFEYQPPMASTGVGELAVGSTIRVRGAETSRLRIAYHAKLKQKYEKAARCPWLKVEADPIDPGSAQLKPRSLHSMMDNVKFIEEPPPSTVDRIP